MTIGEKIKQLRRGRGLSQEKLAEALHVSRSAVAKWETDGGIPEIENLTRLAAVLGVSLDELVGNTAAPSPGSPLQNPPRALDAHLYDIELTGWNDGVYGVYIVGKDADFLYYCQCRKRAKPLYGMMGRRHITSVLPSREEPEEAPPVEGLSRDYFCGRPVKIELAKREGLLRGLLDFRDDAYRNVIVESFDETRVQLQLGGALELANITRIEELEEQ